MSRFSAAVVVFLGLSLTGPSASQELDLSAARLAITSNIIQLQCINVEDGATFPEALFFLNGTNLEDRAPTASVRNGVGVLMLITRDLEGVYTCALAFDPRTSDEETLIGECSAS